MINAAKVLLDKGIKQIIVTLGSKGVLYIDHKRHEFYNAYEVDVVDTTAAGDSFIGGFASYYVMDPNNIDKAIEMGQKTAALSIQKIGAQSSLPTLEDIQNYRWNK